MPFFRVFRVSNEASFEAIAVLKLVLELFLGEKSLSHHRIQEANEDVVDMIIAGQIKKHHTSKKVP